MRYKDLEMLDFVRLASKEAVSFIQNEAGVSESRAQAWIKKYWDHVRRPDTLRKLANEKNDLKIKQREYKALLRSREMLKDLLLDGCQNNRAKRKELAKKAVNSYGYPISRACEELNISEGYYRSNTEK